MTRVRLASGIELDCIDEGPRDGSAIIFLHGFPENARTWRHQIAHLSTRFRCIAPDQRGYRGSSKPAEVGDYAAEKLVADVFQLADALGVERFTIAGHDWGGAIAWLVAMAGQGRRVERAVIANAPHPLVFQKLLWCDSHQRAASQYIRLFRDTAIDPLIHEQGLAPVLGKAFGGANLLSGMEPVEMAALLDQWRDPGTAIAMLNWYRASPIDVPRMDEPFGMAGRSLPVLPGLKIPVLAIWGEDDRALPIANLEGLGEHVPDLAVVRVPACGHFVTWQAPQALNAAMDEFANRL